MSPNPDAAEEELPFTEGQIIKVYGDKDPDGFYRGESGGRLGFVPCNMVSEIQVEDEETRQQLLQRGFLSTAASMEKIVVSENSSTGGADARLKSSPTTFTEFDFSGQPELRLAFFTQQEARKLVHCVAIQEIITIYSQSLTAFSCRHSHTRTASASSRPAAETETIQERCVTLQIAASHPSLPPLHTLHWFASCSLSLELLLFQVAASQLSNQCCDFSSQLSMPLSEVGHADVMSCMLMSWDRTGAELTFSAGDIIHVFGDMDEDGFFYGDLNGHRGLVPSNFLQALPEDPPPDPHPAPPAPEPRKESQGTWTSSAEPQDPGPSTPEEVLPPETKPPSPDPTEHTDPQPKPASPTSNPEPALVSIVWQPPQVFFCPSKEWMKKKKKKLSPFEPSTTT
ncbi:RIMS-binding protein 2 [Collichthys lucidus]|uniref:RIMS-binding protein 2 n=1 Tax=Collichthys lucidus TaxID=240159 RepID=A0A4U5V6S1_COLLU|nr:RIMS-binding protein 2 [Collichthys lucidus]